MSAVSTMYSTSIPVPYMLVASVISQCEEQGWSFVTTLFCGIQEIKKSALDMKGTPLAVHSVVACREAITGMDIKPPEIKL